jgi:hypothetical protein
MRILLILSFAVIPAGAQNSVVRFTNVTHPASQDFQIGDRFEIVIMSAANQPVSVRTTMHGRTDWGPVIGWTDTSGRWSTAGVFEKADFGDWSEVWTVGGELANPSIHFSVGAPCLKGGQSFVAQSGPNISLTCETAEGRRSFGTPSYTEPFRTPDGRVVPGRQSNMTAEQYHAEIMESLITYRPSDTASGRLGDEAGILIAKITGVNALSEDETRNVLALIRAAFEKPELIPAAAKDPSGTLLLLRNLTDSTLQSSLKQQIADTIAYVQAVSRP